MGQRLGHLFRWAALAAGSLASIAPLAAQAQATPQRVMAPSPVVVTFGREGGNMLPLRVTIDATGAVAVVSPGRTPPPVRLSPDALDGLRTLAAAEGIAAMPERQIGRGLPDVGGRFIGVRMGGALKVVHVRYVRNRAFDQLYAVLSAAVGLPG